MKVEGDYRILVITATWPGYWGRGETIAQAKKNCLKESGHTATYYKGKLIAYLAHKDVQMTELAGWRRPKDVPDPIRLGGV